MYNITESLIDEIFYEAQARHFDIILYLNFRNQFFSLFPFETRHSRGIYLLKIYRSPDTHTHTRAWICCTWISSFRLFQHRIFSSDFHRVLSAINFSSTLFEAHPKLKTSESSKLPLSCVLQQGSRQNFSYRESNPTPYLRIFFSDSIDFSLFQRESWNCNAVRGL